VDVLLLRWGRRLGRCTRRVQDLLDLERILAQRVGAREVG
jgi:hypothetical protein